MAYVPPQAWLEVRADGHSRRVHVDRNCAQIRPTSALSGPMLLGVAASGKNTSVCKCSGESRHVTEVPRPRWQVSGGLPTLGGRR